MTLIEAAKQAREAMKYATAPNEVFDFLKADEMLEQAIIALNQAIAKAEQQEPVVHVGDLNEFTAGYLQREGFFLDDPLYAHPPERKWQKLTDEDWKHLYDEFAMGQELDEFAEAIEAKLKEKNT